MVVSHAEKDKSPAVQGVKVGNRVHPRCPYCELTFSPANLERFGLAICPHCQLQCHWTLTSDPVGGIYHTWPNDTVSEEEKLWAYRYTTTDDCVATLASRRPLTMNQDEILRQIRRALKPIARQLETLCESLMDACDDHDQEERCDVCKLWSRVCRIEEAFVSFEMKLDQVLTRGPEPASCDKDTPPGNKRV